MTWDGTVPEETTEALISCLFKFLAKISENAPLSMRALISFCFSASTNNLKVMLTGALLLGRFCVENPGISMSEGSILSDVAMD